MKYIRTKDGKIYDSLALRVEEIAYKDEQGKWCREYRTFDPLKKALKIADTIEELCDEFVEYNREKNKGFYIREYELKECKNVVRKEPSILEHTDIFGAIWTNKGLIFVARMNNEGELELL